MSAATKVAPKFTAVLDNDATVTVERDGVRFASARAVLDDHPIADAFWSALTPRQADLGDVAVAVYAVDRLCRRPGADVWRRTIKLTVPVRDAGFWQRADVTEALVDLLTYLSDDTWSIEFVGRRAEPRASEHPTLFPLTFDAPVRAALFSGGLDSAAGFVKDAIDHPEAHFALFSAQTGTRTRAPQTRQLGLLNQRFPGRLTCATATFGFAAGDEHHFDREERTQRTRGFAFQSLGAIAALLAGASELQIFENGVGAINLPYLDSQLGSHCTRSTSPITLALNSRLVSLVVETDFRFTLPHLLSTKGELCDVVREQGLERLVGHTFSCDHFPQRRPSTDHCGVCSSCLLRRQSLFAAGLGSIDGARYVHAFPTRLTGNRRDLWFAFYAMDAQVSRISDSLGVSARSSGSMEHQFPVFAETLEFVKPTVQRSDLIALFQRYCDEWGRFRDVLVSYAS
jgi:hypothetical protein